MTQAHDGTLVVEIPMTTVHRDLIGRFRSESRKSEDRTLRAWRRKTGRVPNARRFVEIGGIGSSAEPTDIGALKHQYLKDLGFTNQ